LIDRFALAGLRECETEMAVALGLAADHTGGANVLLLPELAMLDKRITSRLAAISVKLGFLALVFAGWWFLFMERSYEGITLVILALGFTAVTGLPALVWGSRGLRGILRNQGRPRELALAGTGLAIGVVGTGLGSLLLLAGVERVQDAADRQH
jgi:hypothetical protein